MNVSNWIALGSVIVAIAAVLAALLQDDWRRFRWTPQLEQVNQTVSVAKIRVGEKRYDSWAYIRLRIGVKAGRRSAKQVQVYLVTCKPAPKLGGEEQMPDVEFLIPLRWSFDHAIIAEIPAGGARYLDVLEVKRNPDDGSTSACLTTEPAPIEGYQLVGSQAPYVLDVRIMGDNINPKKHSFRILHTGSWEGTTDGLTGHIDAIGR